MVDAAVAARHRVIGENGKVEHIIRIRVGEVGHILHVIVKITVRGYLGPYPPVFFFYDIKMGLKQRNHLIHELEQLLAEIRSFQLDV